MNWRLWLIYLGLALMFAACFLGPLFAVRAFAARAFAHVDGCHTTKCDRRIHRARAERWCAKHQVCLLRRAWKAQPAGWRGWAISTARCESNLRWSINTGNGFLAGHQWLPRTWFVAVSLLPPKLRTSSLPQYVGWQQQSLAAIAYARRYGTGAWPVCSPW